jgi:O-antigen ligase
VLAFALERHPSVLYGATAMASAAVGLMLVRAQGGAPVPMIALGGLALLVLLVLLVSVPPPTLFVGWFFAAPLLAESTAASSVGHVLMLVLYAFPALVLACLTATQFARNVSLTLTDFLPAAFAVYVVVSLSVASQLIELTLARTLLILFLNYLLGPCLYYFLIVGPGRLVETSKLLLVLMVGACIQGVLAIVEHATHWNLWGSYHWNKLSGTRAVSTFANPAILGVYLGIGTVIAVAILMWHPNAARPLRRTALLTVVVCPPGLLLTLTRAPIAATAVAVVALLTLGRKRLAGFGIIAVALVALVAAWPHLEGSSLYQNRVTDVETVLERQSLQEMSVEVAKQKPVLGWGLGSFGRAIATVEPPYIAGLIDSANLSVSHNTFLSVLVELGGLGLLLLFVPFIVIGTKALARARSSPADRWIVGAASGSLVVVMLTATANDYHYFSLVPALSFVMLAILRRMTGDWSPHADIARPAHVAP